MEGRKKSCIVVPSIQFAIVPHHSHHPCRPLLLSISLFHTEPIPQRIRWLSCVIGGATISDRSQVVGSSGFRGIPPHTPA